ncbi:FAD-dependent oxidoreductase, partial [Micromonospora sp. ATA32]|nr:FAD-dependent oxidoreductase [Micromonospora sp. ATA32]
GLRPGTPDNAPIIGVLPGRPGVLAATGHHRHGMVGATVEERSDTEVTAGAVLRLLRAAVDLLPELAEYDLAEATAGLRPGTPDNAPIIGVLPGRPGVLAATGHHRHGIVLTPVTADLITELIVTGEADPLLAPFTPDRFGPDQTREDDRWK